MSLRIFHVVFVLVCDALCLFVGIWGIRQYVQNGDGGGLALGIVFLLAGAVLVAYGIKVFGKLKEVD